MTGRKRVRLSILGAIIGALFIGMLGGNDLAARDKRPKAGAPVGATQAAPTTPAAPVPPATPDAPPRETERVPAAVAVPTPVPKPTKETVEADVSTRSVAVTSAFTGTEIVVFGTVNHSQQESAEAGLYDVIIILEGGAHPVVARRKSNVAGIWLNTSSMRFDRVPSFYAIAATRPIDEIADPDVLKENRIGFEHSRIEPAIGATSRVTAKERENFVSAVVRLKQRDGLYFQEDYGVVFIGRSLFRSTIGVPANVPVGTLSAHVYLFRDGEMLSKYTAKVTLARQGLESIVYNLALRSPLGYGLIAVALAMVSGLAASAAFGRKAS